MRTPLLATLFIAGPLLTLGQAPIVLNQANFPVPAAAAERSQSATITGISLPLRGANRTWDYSSLTPRSGISPFTLQYTASTNAALPGASRYYQSQFGFGAAFSLQTRQYEAAGATGLFRAGFEVPRQQFSVGAATGNPNDSITFPLQTQALQPRPATLPFPATYPLRFTNAFYRSATNYRLKVVAFGLNNTPGQFIQRVTSAADSVVGWGTLRIPTATGASNPVRVLLVRQQTTEVDSFYLAGAPAPAVLLAAFGFTQGQTIVGSAWRFYREGSSQPVLSFFQNPSTGQLTSITYSLETNIGLGTRAAQAGRLAGLAVAPQPIGGELRLQADGLPGEVLQAEVRDLTGRRVASGALGVGVASELMRELKAGLYLLHLRSTRGEETVLRVVKE
jgi:hypothetical protein